MAFNDYTLRLIVALAAEAKCSAPASIACIGYPDMLVHPNALRELLHLPHDCAMPIRSDSEAVLAWHGIQSDGMMVIETEWVLYRLGFASTYFDVRKVRGPEVIQDMNEPLADDAGGGFDIVYDAGTLEHCFNIGQAMKNVLALARVGGAIYHGHPHNVGNHGFYNICPTFYHDWYTQNGHSLRNPGAQLVLNGEPIGALPIIGRYGLNLERETWIQCVAHKRHDGAPHWPMQTKYIQNPSLAGGSGRLN